MVTMRCEGLLAVWLTLRVQAKPKSDSTSKPCDVSCTESGNGHLQRQSESLQVNSSPVNKQHPHSVLSGLHSTHCTFTTTLDPIQSSIKP